jgi:DNA-binding SARP family transcriptional activator
MAVLQIELLGEFRLWLDEQELTAAFPPRLQSLLAWLVLHAGTPQSRSYLAYTLWPDSTEEQAHTNLRKLLYQLRSVLPQAERFLVSDFTTVCWRRDAPYELDVAAFEAAAERAQSPEEIAAALSLYRGEFLPACYEEWVLIQREQLHQQFLELLERGMSQATTARDYSRALSYGQRLLAEEPLREEIYQRLMQLYALKGDRAAALAVYHRCATTLQRELGVEPSLATQELYMRLLNMKEAPPPPAVLPPLVGRQAEWEQLLAVWRAAYHGAAQVVLLVGEAGIGKTRLAEEFGRWAIHQGIRVLTTSCYPADEGLTLAPVAALLRAQPLPPLEAIWLSEVSRLLPEVLSAYPHVPPPQPMSDPWQRLRFFEALGRTLLGSGEPLVVILDDLQQADSETLAWLHYLLQAWSGARLLVISTLRAEEWPLEWPLETLWSDLRTAGRLWEVAVPPLDQEATGKLATLVWQGTLKPEQIERLYRETEGNPLFILEFLRAGWLEQPEGISLPSTLRTVMMTRLARLSPQAQEVTGLAATIGRAFRLGVLVAASERREEEVVRAVDELWQRRIVREQADGYEFSHDKLRDVAYERLSMARRRLLHRRVGEALECDGSEQLAGEIGRHFELAGLVERAAPYWVKAGDAARAVYAHEAAIEYYQRALPHLERTERSAVLCKLGAVRQLRGQWREAEGIYREALALAEENGSVEAQARCQLALGDVLQLQSAYGEALRWLARAQEMFAALGDQEGVGQAIRLIGFVYWKQSDFPRARAYLQQAYELARQLGDRFAMSKALGELGVVYWDQNDYERALACYQQQHQLAQEIGDLVGVERAIGHMGLVYWQQGNHSRALACYEEQLTRAQAIGDRQAMNWALGNMGIVYEERGNYPRALEYYHQQLQIVQELGDQRSLATALENMGIVYADQGEYERALACHRTGLAIACEINARFLVAHAVGNLARIAAAQGRYQEAEALYERAVRLEVALQQPYYICEYCYNYAELLARQGRYAEARRHTDEALHSANELGRRDIQFGAQVLQLQLRARQKEIETPAAIAELEQLLVAWPEEKEQAAVHYAIWQLDSQQHWHSQQAAKRYRQLYASTPNIEYRQRYMELTGRELPQPAPLPPPPALVGERSLDLATPLKRVDQLLAELEAENTSPSTSALSVSTL